MPGRDEHPRARDISRSRSRSRTRAHRDDRNDRRDVKGKERWDDRRRSRSASPRRRSRSPQRRRSRSPDRQYSRRRSRSRSISPDRDHDRRERARRRDPSRDRARRRSRSRSRSVSSASSSGHRKEKKHHHKRKRSRSRSTGRERKKEKKDKKKKKSGAVGSEWGKYGILTETDMYNKEDEFRAWLVEERKINPETVSKDQTRKEFAKFVEDYNTATLPHEKFYNMAKYEARMNALRAGEFVPPADDKYDPDADMRALQTNQRDKRKAHDSTETYLSKEQLMELRKVQAQRVEVGKMKLLGMDVKTNFGVRMDGSQFDE